jgi:hypothetical protein
MAEKFSRKRCEKINTENCIKRRKFVGWGEFGGLVTRGLRIAKYGG